MPYYVLHTLHFSKKKNVYKNNWQGGELVKIPVES